MTAETNRPPAAGKFAKTAVPAHGYAKGPSRRIVVSFDEETFGQIRQQALAEGVSFAARVRDLVEWGLLADEEAA